MDGSTYLSNSLRISDLVSELRSSPYTDNAGGLCGRKTGAGHLYGFHKLHVSSKQMAILFL